MLLSEANDLFGSTSSRFGIITKYFQKCFEERNIGEGRHMSGLTARSTAFSISARPDATSPSTQFVRAKKAVAAAR